MLGSQRGHGVEWQVRLAHLLRDARYAVECGDVAFSAAFKHLLLRAIAIGRRRDTLKDTTLKQYHADLDRRLDRIMAALPIGEPGRKLRKRIAANRGHLFVFVTNRCVPYTNNVCERNLRPSVIFRKVTNGFRCEWGAETYAAFRSVVSKPTTLRSLRSSNSCWPPDYPSSHPPRRGEQLPFVSERSLPSTIGRNGAVMPL
jgi:transposase